MSIKEDVIIEILTELTNKFLAEDINYIKDILILKFKNIEMKHLEKSLVVTENENASFVKKFIAVKKIKRLYRKNIKSVLSRIG